MQPLNVLDCFYRSFTALLHSFFQEGASSGSLNDQRSEKELEICDSLVVPFRSNGSLVLLIRLFGELDTPVKLVNALILTSYRMNPGLTRFIAEL